MTLCQHYFGYMVLDKIVLQKAFSFIYWYFFGRNNILEPNEHFFQKSKSSLEVQRTKKLFSDNPRHKILEHYSVFIQVLLVKVKQKLISGKTNLLYELYELPHELPNDLRLRILVNQEILEKSQIRVEKQSGSQSPFQKLKLNQQLKNTEKQISNFSCLVRFYQILFQIFCPRLQKGTGHSQL